MDAPGLHRLTRLQQVLAANPDLINPQLTPTQHAAYCQVFHDHVGAFALDMADLATPARVMPFEIKTFGPPAARPPICAPPTHARFIAKEVSELRTVGLVRT